ncbi:MAG: hypothetical protein K6E71_10910 [Lachnospiraceae bacterium]|nr:hypothetical protein [Lachnospiraceae bacterium]
MKKCIRLLSVTLFVLLLFVGCSGKSGNVTPSETPSVTQEPASATPTDSVEVTPTATPTQGIVFSDCLERMQPFEGDEQKGFLSVIGVLDGHKVYNAYLQTYKEREEKGFVIGWGDDWTVWSKDSPSKNNIRGPYLTGALNLLEDDEYVFLAVIATPTLEVLEAAEQKAHDAWIAEGNTEADWYNYLGYEAKREALSQAGVKAIEGLADVLYAEGCPIIVVGEYYGPYVTTIISKQKLLDICERGGETFNYIFYEESWLRYAEANNREWRH